MSGKKISEMTAITGAQLDQTNDVLPVLDVSDTTNPNKKISIQELASVLSSSGTTNVDLSLDGSNNLTLTDSDANTVTVDLSSLDNSSLSLQDVTANGSDTVDSDLAISVANGNAILRLNRTGSQAGSVQIMCAGNGAARLIAQEVRLEKKLTVGNSGISPSVTLDIQGTDAVQLTSGTTAERPVTPANGMIRYNSETDVYEGYSGDTGLGDGSFTRFIKVDSLNTDRVYVGDSSNNYIKASNSYGTALHYGNDSILHLGNSIRFTSLGGEGHNFRGNKATIGNILTIPSVTLDIQGTDAVQLTAGTTAERPTAAAGMIRFNTDTSKFEGYDGASWIDLN